MKKNQSLLPHYISCWIAIRLWASFHVLVWALLVCQLSFWGVHNKLLPITISVTYWFYFSLGGESFDTLEGAYWTRTMLSAQEQRQNRDSCPHALYTHPRSNGIEKAENLRGEAVRTPQVCLSGAVCLECWTAGLNLIFPVCKMTLMNTHRSTVLKGKTRKCSWSWLEPWQWLSGLLVNQHGFITLLLHAKDVLHIASYYLHKNPKRRVSFPFYGQGNGGWAVKLIICSKLLC